MNKQELSNKLETLVSKTPSKWIEESNKRFENLEGLRYSQQVALRILRILREKKLSQKDLADSLNVSPQTVNKWVKGSENLSLFTIAKIEEALGQKIIDICKESTKRVIFLKTNHSEINTRTNNSIQSNLIKAPKESKVIPLNQYVSDSIYRENNNGTTN